MDCRNTMKIKETLEKEYNELVSEEKWVKFKKNINVAIVAIIVFILFNNNVALFGIIVLIFPFIIYNALIDHKLRKLKKERHDLSAILMTKE